MSQPNNPQRKWIALSILFLFILSGGIYRMATKKSSTLPSGAPTEGGTPVAGTTETGGPGSQQGAAPGAPTTPGADGATTATTTPDGSTTAGTTPGAATPGSTTETTPATGTAPQQGAAPVAGTPSQQGAAPIAGAVTTSPGTATTDKLGAQGTSTGPGGAVSSPGTPTTADGKSAAPGAPGAPLAGKPGTPSVPGTPGAPGIPSAPGVPVAGGPGAGKGEAPKSEVAVAPAPTPVPDSCVSVTFHHKPTPQHTNEEACSHHKNLLTLTHKNVNPKSVCVRVNGTPVHFMSVKGRPSEVLIGAIAGPKAKVVVSYCTGKAKCQVKDDCAVPRDEFMEAIGGTDGKDSRDPRLGQWDPSSPSGKEADLMAKLDGTIKKELETNADINSRVGKLEMFKDWVNDNEAPACGTRQASNI